MSPPLKNNELFLSLGSVYSGPYLRTYKPVPSEAEQLEAMPQQSRLERESPIQGVKNWYVTRLHHCYHCGEQLFFVQVKKSKSPRLTTQCVAFRHPLTMH